MQGITTCLAFKDRGAEAVAFYVSLFPNSKIVHMERYQGDDGGPLTKGQLLHATFQLDGREFAAMDGGPSFSFAQGMSIMVNCDSQEEIDRLWDRLTSGGGEPGRCGWLTDRYGVSWQIIPAELGKMLTDAKAGNSTKAMEAMLKMSKLDVKTLEAAYRQK
jgi:predicted 3-demethylubiquinone-9 3-methyltransferase (glyoxalase superfamily)